MRSKTVRMRFIIFFFLFQFLNACNSVQSEIAEADLKITSVENDLSNYSEKDWDKLKIQIDKLETDLQKNRSNYTEEQIKQIGRLQGRYAAVLLKRELNNFKESLQDAGNQLDGFIEGMKDGLKKSP